MNKVTKECGISGEDVPIEKLINDVMIYSQKGRFSEEHQIHAIWKQKERRETDAGAGGALKVKRQISGLDEIIRTLEIELETETKLKDQCDKMAAIIANRSNWLFLLVDCLVLAVWTSLIHRFGWDKMEAWTYLAGLLFVVANSAYFAIFRKKFNSDEVRARRLEKEKERQYALNRFSETNYERLKADLEKFRKERERLLEE